MKTKGASFRQSTRKIGRPTGERGKARRVDPASRCEASGRSTNAGVRRRCSQLCRAWLTGRKARLAAVRRGKSRVPPTGFERAEKRRKGRAPPDDTPRWQKIRVILRVSPVRTLISGFYAFSKPANWRNDMLYSREKLSAPPPCALRGTTRKNCHFACGRCRTTREK